MAGAFSSAFSTAFDIVDATAATYTYFQYFYTMMQASRL